MKLVFPFTNRAFRLVLTAPVTERTFSKLKTEKTCADQELAMRG
jgi:hypothetical protein